ncbi:Erythrocyte membrane binding protein [Staphylococcus aureus]|nr:Erythrocyte membrane binding protein [Staphylococcus aureus]
MNYRDKIQKFSIRKYTVGTFSTVIATLVFLGLNTSQAQAAETNQPASALKQKQQNGDTQTENREVEVQNSQNGQSLSAPIENEQPNNNQTNHVDASAVQSSTTEHDQPVSQNEQAKKDTAAATPTQSAKAASKHEQSESRAANKKENDNKATHVESHEANVVTASDSSDSGNVQHDRNELQAFFDANYHDYRFIDRENADSGTFNYVKGIFDKINTLLGSNDPINNKDLQLAYKELEQAVALIRTMPQRQQTSRRSSRIQTRSIESRAAEPRSVSDYQNANSSYYVENANDGSGYPVGTYINASSKGAPYNLPTTPWNTLKASDAKEIALITAKQTGDGYQWVIKFNKGHAPHENMIYWFALPAGQTPVGRTEFVTVNADGTNVQWSNGAGAGANKPLPEMWPYGVNDSRSWDYKIRNRSGQVIYDWPTVHINSLKDLARASDYFSEAGATPATKAFGRQTFEYINGERPTESPGVPKVYTFIGKGDASYTISFKTQGPTIDKLYYAAGGRALEYNQLFMYSQLYVESTQDYQQRLNGLRQVVNRTYRIGTTKRVEVSQGNVQTKKVLESTNLNIDDFMDDPLSYVKTPSNKVLGFYPTSANTNAFRPGGVNPLNEYQLSQLFTDDKLQQAARTGSPIRLMIGFDYPDAFGNGETLVPVNLTVLPEIQHNIKFFKNDDGQNIADKPASKQAGHPVFYVYAGNQGNASVNLGGSVTSIQPLRINLTSNENFTDKDWQITGIPRTLHIENSTNRTNNARERNIELVGNLLPGDYFGTIRFGRKEQLFEIRVKPHTPRITTTAEELRGTALQKVPVTVTDIPLDPSALVYLVIPTSQTRDGGSEADQIPSGYTKIATGTPDGVHSTITIRPEDYVVFIPPVGNQIRALIFYNNVVASNMSNAVTILPDDIPPTINNPVGLNAKYYRGDEVSFTMGVSDRHSGLKSTTITTLPSGWTSNLTKSDKKNGSLAISGRVSMNQAYNSDITFKVSATDNVNNTTNDSQSKHVTVHVGKISDDAHPIVLGNSEKVVVVNPTALTGDEKQRITTAEIIDTPSTATISDSLTAKVEVTLLDGSKVIVNVPVKVVEKELTVVKQQAIESIENAAQQKINEINNHATLTPEQKEAAIAEVNKLKQQAIEQINNAADVHTVEEVQHQEQAHIEQFNPDQFTIDQAKSNAIKSISDAIQHMIDEINASKDLTDKEKQEAISKLNQLKDQSIQAIQRAQSIDEIAQQLEQFKAQLKAANPFAKELENRKKAAISKIKDISTDKIDRIRNSTIGTAEERQAAMNRINEIVLETIKDINNAQTPQQVEAALNNGIARILAVQIVTSDHSKPSSNSDGQSNSHLHVGYGTVNHPFNSSPIGHKKKLDQDDEIDPLHMRHFGDRIGNVIKNALGVVGISGLLASFWFFIAKRRRKEDEEEELEIRDNSKDKKKGSIEGTKHLPLLFAKRRRKEDEEDAIVEEKDSLNNDESLDKVKHTPFFLPKRRRKEDEEDVEVTNENTDEKVLQDNEHSPVLIAKRLKDKDGNVETTTSIESKDEDVPLLLAKKKNQKDNQSKGKKSASKKPSKKVAAKKKKKKSKKIKNNLFLR